MSGIQEDLRDTLLKFADGLAAGNTTLTEKEMRFILDSLRAVTEDKISKYQACQFLGISRSKFDSLVMEGRIPKGRKQTGFKELFWYRSELKNITMDK